MPPGYSQSPKIPAWLAWLALDHLACDSSRTHLAETFLETSKLWIHPSILVKPVMWKAFQKQNFKYRLNFPSILTEGWGCKYYTFHLFSHRDLSCNISVFADTIINNKIIKSNQTFFFFNTVTPYVKTISNSFPKICVLLQTLKGDFPWQHTSN